MHTRLIPLLCLLALAGCASEYLVITSDGQVYNSDGEPDLDKDTGMFEFEDLEGRKQQIPQSEVKQILER
ncbi:MAG: YgdI/YgdR family lipoprotein [Pseudomonadaceae bacterium]|nr:YgdI/YgdR family lipoprotein [Pseudomonadaceae bacterium]